MSGTEDPKRAGSAEAPAGPAARRGGAGAPGVGGAEGDPRWDDLPEDGDLPLVDEVDVRELLRGALRTPAGPPPNLLRGVQRRIRTRSRGKFYGDGWSTARSPRSTYLMTSLFMLALIALVFLVLIPWSGGALP